MIRTLIVEDDFRVAEIHAAYVALVEGFEVIGKAQNGESAFEMIVSQHPDLVLLDLYLPDEQGLDLYARVQKLPERFRMDVFIITAARDSQSVKEALQLGAANYIVKPFTQKQLSDRLIAYKDGFTRLSTFHEISQAEVDHVTSLMRGVTPILEFNFGATKPTIESITNFLKNADSSLSASEVSEGVGISRATSQRYLSQMVDRRILSLELQYGTAGRPIHKYGPIERK